MFKSLILCCFPPPPDFILLSVGTSTLLSAEWGLITLNFLHSITYSLTFLALGICFKMHPFEEVVLVFKWKKYKMEEILFLGVDFKCNEADRTWLTRLL